MNEKSKTKKLVINAMLLAIGAVLHQITPALGLPMEPDMALAMLFTVMILNKGDYKTCLISGIITGIFTAMTTKFPGGQLPNIIDKFITINLAYITMMCILKIKAIGNLSDRKQNNILVYTILPVGTLISGTSFLLSAKLLVGLPALFTVLFTGVVLPATVINLITGIFLFKIVLISLNRVSYSN